MNIDNINALLEEFNAKNGTSTTMNDYIVSEYRSTSRFMTGFPYGETIYIFDKKTRVGRKITPIMTIFCNGGDVVLYYKSKDGEMKRATISSIEGQSYYPVEKYYFFRSKDELEDFILFDTSRDGDSHRFCFDKVYLSTIFERYGYKEMSSHITCNAKVGCYSALKGYSYNIDHNYTFDTNFPFYLWDDKDGLHMWVTKGQGIYPTETGAREDFLKSYVTIED